MRTIINSRRAATLALALPAAWLLYRFASGQADAMEMLHPTGEVSARLMILAMMIGPAADIFGTRPWTRWLLVRRRWVGFAAFLYAVAHLAFYLVDMGTMADVLAEIGEVGIWTGWLAMLAMAVAGLTSNDAAMRGLQRGWKQVQRLVYPAALLTLLHWGLLEWRWQGALLHFAPLAILNITRLVLRGRHFTTRMQNA